MDTVLTDRKFNSLPLPGGGLGWGAVAKPIEIYKVMNVLQQPPTLILPPAGGGNFNRAVVDLFR